MIFTRNSVDLARITHTDQICHELATALFKFGGDGSLYRINQIFETEAENKAYVLRFVSIDHKSSVDLVKVGGSYRGTMYNETTNKYRCFTTPHDVFSKRTIEKLNTNMTDKLSAFEIFDDSIDFFVPGVGGSTLTDGDVVNYKKHGVEHTFTVISIHDKAIFGQDGNGEPRMIKHSDVDALRTMGIEVHDENEGV